MTRCRVSCQNVWLPSHRKMARNSRKKGWVSTCQCEERFVAHPQTRAPLMSAWAPGSSLSFSCVTRKVLCGGRFKLAGWPDKQGGCLRPTFPQSIKMSHLVVYIYDFEVLFPCSPRVWEADYTDVSGSEQVCDEEARTDLTADVADAKSPSHTYMNHRTTNTRN